MRKSKKTIKEKITINVGETIIDEKYGDNELFVSNDKTQKTYFSNSQMWVNKYRPRTLHDIIGHDEIKKTLLIRFVLFLAF